MSRGGKTKAAATKGKKSMKGGKKESYDLIVNIDLEEWRLTPEQVSRVRNCKTELEMLAYRLQS